METLFWFLFNGTFIGLMAYPFFIGSPFVWIAISFCFFLVTPRRNENRKMATIWVIFVLFYLLTFIVQLITILGFFRSAFIATIAVLIYNLIGYILYRLFMHYRKKRQNLPQIEQH